MTPGRKNKSRYLLHVAFEISLKFVQYIQLELCVHMCSLSLNSTTFPFYAWLCLCPIAAGLSLSRSYRRWDIMVERVPDWGSRIPGRTLWILRLGSSSPNLNWTCSNSKEISDPENPFTSKILLLFAGPQPRRYKIPFLQPSLLSPQASRVGTFSSWTH